MTVSFKKVKVTTIIFILLLQILLLASCDIFNLNESDEIRFTFSKDSSRFGGTLLLNENGAIADTSLRSVLLTCFNAGDSDINRKGILEVEYINTSDITELEFKFTTIQDPDETSFKTILIPLNESNKTITQSIDVSNNYGWLGNLKSFKISAKGINKGSLILKSITIKNGGEIYPPMNIGPEEIVYTAQDRINMRLGGAPDGILGQVRNSDGSITFFASNMGKIVKTTGTEDDPFKTVNYSYGVINNVDPSVYKYSSIAQVIGTDKDGTLIGITHLEKNLDESVMSYVASIGLSKSTDNGDNWDFIGEIISCDIPDSELITVSRDAGNGTILIKDGYLYVYISDMNDETAVGLSVSRAKLDDVISDMKNNKATKFFKWFNNEWSEPGLGGKFTSIIAKDKYPNFCYIQYNTVLKKYIMIMTTSPYYRYNDGDIGLYISDSPMDFTGTMYWIACGKRGEQYPTMISFENDSQTTSGNEFYIYYCSWNAFNQEGKFDWQSLWGTSNYVRRKVSVIREDIIDEGK